MLSKVKTVALLNLATAFCGAISALLGGFLLRRYVAAPWNTALATSAEILLALVTALAMLATTTILVALDRQQQRAKTEIRGDVGAQVQSIKASLLELRSYVEFRLEELSLTQLPRDLPVDFFLALARPLLRRYRDRIDYILRGARSFSVREYYAEACSIIGSLVSGDKVEAVCADIRWGLAEAISYFIENIAAAKRGAAVTRIFVVPTREIPSRLRRWMDRHVDAGATVLLLTKESELYRTLPDLFVPDGVGFVLLTRDGQQEARVHYSGSGPQNFGKLYREPEVVRMLQAWFDELKRVAEVYRPTRFPGEPVVPPERRLGLEYGAEGDERTAAAGGSHGVSLPPDQPSPQCSPVDSISPRRKRTSTCSA